MTVSQPQSLSLQSAKEVRNLEQVGSVILFLLPAMCVVESIDHMCPEQDLRCGKAGLAACGRSSYAISPVIMNPLLNSSRPELPAPLPGVWKGLGFSVLVLGPKPWHLVPSSTRRTEMHGV